MPIIKIYWELSSAGEHMTEDHGVRGPTPRVPIFLKIKLKIYKQHLSIWIMPRKKEVEKSKAKDKNPEALGIAGFTLGIISLVLLLFSPALGIFSAIVGFFFCLFQQRKKKTRTARIGMIINIVSFGVNIVWWIVYALVVYPVMQQSIETAGSALP